MAIATRPRSSIAMKVGQRRPPFVDLVGGPPFCRLRNDDATGDGSLSDTSFDSPSYREVLSDRDSRGVFSSDASE